MNGNNAQQNDPNRDLLCAVLDDGQIALVRVQGKGNFGNSMALKKFASHVQDHKDGLQFIVDLNDCETMDSTFMGVLAGIAIQQIRTQGPKMTVVNPNEQCHRQLKNLGLSQLVDLRTGSLHEVERAEQEFKPAEASTASRAEQICLTLQAHKELVNLDEQNQVRFQAVIDYLEKSLQDGEGC